MRGDWERLQVPHNVRCRIMPPSGDFLPDWEMFARHFTTLLVDPYHPHFPQKW